MSLFLLQDPETTPENLEEVVSEEKTLSIFNLIMEGGLGGQIIIALLFVLIIDRLVYLFRKIFGHKSGYKDR